MHGSLNGCWDVGGQGDKHELAEVENFCNKGEIGSKT